MTQKPLFIGWMLQSRYSQLLAEKLGTKLYTLLVVLVSVSLIIFGSGSKFMLVLRQRH